MKRFWSLLERLVVALESIAVDLTALRQCVVVIKQKGVQCTVLNISGSLNTFEQNNGRVSF